MSNLIMIGRYAATTSEVELVSNMEAPTDITTEESMDLEIEEVSSGADIDYETTDEVIVDEGFVEDGYFEDGYIDPGMETGTGMAEVKDPLLSSWPFVMGISVAVLVVSIALGALLAKLKIKKGIDLYED